jgi:hypothetical protein
VIFKYCLGIDWASDKYDICAVDQNGKECGRKQVEHSGDGIRQCIDWMLRLTEGDASAVAAAIEVPHGAMVESLIENNVAVFAINPKQLDRFRDRHTVAGAKDDDLDAFVLADSLRTDQSCFHRVELDEPAILRLRELSRMAQDLQTDSNRLSNQLWEQLRRYYPQMLKLSPGADEVWLWDLLELAPLPEIAAKLKLGKVKAILKGNRIRRITAEAVLEQLRPRQPASTSRCCCRAYVCCNSSERQLAGAYGVFWANYANRRRRVKGASIVTQRSCFPCRELGRSSPPRCSPRLRSLSEIEIIRLYAIMLELRR